MADQKEDPKRFEFSDGKSHKFWVVQLDGRAHTVTYGRIGTAGQTKTKELPDEEKARKSYDKLIAAKVKKGYKEIEQAKPMSPEEIKAEKAYEKQMLPFVNSILDDPELVENYSVLGDWLTEQGDPRGELVGVQVALEAEGLTTAQRKKLVAQESSLLKKHARDWLGSLAPYLIDQKDYDSTYRGLKCYEYKFARGVLDSISTDEFSLGFGHELKNSMHCRTLRTFLISTTGYLESPVTVDGVTYDEDSDAGIETLVGAKFDNLRSFTLGDDDHSCHSEGEVVAEVVRKMPRIEELKFGARGIDTEALFKLKMPNLRSLIVHHLTDYPIEVLAKNKSLTNLETLKIHPHAFEYDEAVSAYLRFEHIKALARSKSLQSLQNLQFRMSDMGNPGIEEIIKSGLLGRLKVLDLEHGCVTDEGVDMLVASSDLAKLERLVLDGNAITDDGVAKLKKSGVKFSAKEQLDPDTLEDEREYLWYGDME